MRKFASIAFTGLTLLLTACSGENKEGLKPGEYQILGLAQKAPDGDVVTIYDEFDNPIMKTQIKGEAFEFRGFVDTIMLRRIGTPTIETACMLFLEPGVTRVDLSSGSATGTPFNNEVEILTDSLSAIVNAKGDYEAYIRRAWLESYHRHKHDALGAYLFPYVANAISLADLQEELQTAQTNLRESSIIKQILRRKRLKAEADSIAQAEIDLMKSK